MSSLLETSTTEPGGQLRSERRFDLPARRRSLVAPRAVKVLLALQVLATLLFAGHALGLYGGRGDLLWNQVVYEFGVAPAVAICAWRTFVVAEDRRAWALITLAIVLYVAGDLSWWLTIYEDPSPPYPSVTDALYLSYYVPLLAGLVVLIRSRVGRLEPGKLLEGIVGGLALASLAAAITLDPDVASTQGQAAAVVTSLAYPSMDIALLCVLAGGLIFQGSRLTSTFGLVACGLTVAAISDCFLVLATAGDGYREGGPIDIGWPASMVLIACAAWAQPTTRPRSSRRTATNEHVLTVGFGVLIAGLFAAEALAELSPVARILLQLAVLALLAQLFITNRERSRLARHRERMRAQLHDDALQYVLAARQDLGLVAEGDSAALPYARSALESLTIELRRVMLDLTPQDVTPSTLQAAVVEATADAARRGGFSLKVDLPADIVGSHSELVFALVREFVGNAAKHAAATHVDVRASRAGDGIEVTVADDGCGLHEDQRAQAVRAGHIGLALATRRVEAAGGTLTVSGTTGEGTHVAVRLPRRASNVRQL